MSFCFFFFQGFARPRGEKGPRGSTGGQVKFLVPSCETVFFYVQEKFFHSVGFKDLLTFTFLIFYLQGLSGAPGSPGDTGVIGLGVSRTTSIAGL